LGKAYTYLRMSEYKPLSSSDTIQNIIMSLLQSASRVSANAEVAHNLTLQVEEFMKEIEEYFSKEYKAICDSMCKSAKDYNIVRRNLATALLAMSCFARRVVKTLPRVEEQVAESNFESAFMFLDQVARELDVVKSKVGTQRLAFEKVADSIQESEQKTADATSSLVHSRMAYGVSGVAGMGASIAMCALIMTAPVAAPAVAVAAVAAPVALSGLELAAVWSCVGLFFGTPVGSILAMRKSIAFYKIEDKFAKMLTVIKQISDNIQIQVREVLKIEESLKQAGLTTGADLKNLILAWQKVPSGSQRGYLAKDIQDAVAAWQKVDTECERTVARMDAHDAKYLGRFLL